MKVLYTAHATATGEGRNGHARTSDGPVYAARGPVNARV